MTLKEFVLTFVDLETIIRVYVRDYDESINLWCYYSGKAKKLMLREDIYTCLLSSNVEFIQPSFKKIQAMLDIHTVKE